jgi:CDP-diacylglycerol--glycerol-3-phosphate 3-phosphatidyltransferase
MNMPNKLTIFRIILSPVFLLFLITDTIPFHYIFALIIFIIASITDMIDGNLARKNNQITDFGKFLDPLADKILVAAALVGFVELNLISSWFAVIILTREFLVSSLRLVVAGSGTVIAASLWGKLKTTFTLISIILILTLQSTAMLFNLTSNTAVMSVFYWVGTFFIAVSTVFTIISGAQYLSEHRHHVDVKK